MVSEIMQSKDAYVVMKVGIFHNAYIQYQLHIPAPAPNINCTYL